MDPLEPAPDALPSGNDPARLPDARALGWNWAGFLMPYPWLFGHGRLTWGMILIVTAGLPLLGFLHLIAYPVAAFYLGKRGFEIAWTYRPYHSLEQLREDQREWILWGVVFKVLLLLGMVFSVVYLVWIFRQPDILEMYREMLAAP